MLAVQVGGGIRPGLRGRAPSTGVRPESQLRLVVLAADPADDEGTHPWIRLHSLLGRGFAVWRAN